MTVHAGDSTPQISAEATHKLFTRPGGSAVADYEAHMRNRRRLGNRVTPLADRFWSKVEKSDGCWLWTGASFSFGYGQFLLYGHRSMAAHRLSWELTYGPITDGLGVLHKCDVPACVRPDHLFLGTHGDNLNDMAMKGRGRGAATPRLTPADVRYIRATEQAHVTDAELSRRFGVAGNTIRCARLRRTWKHV